jgi:hypothetical protein
VKQANVTLKDAIFQASSHVRHVIDPLTMNTSKGKMNDAFVLAFTDGGPDHIITFLNVMIFLPGYFNLDKSDFLVVARTTSTQS